MEKSSQLQYVESLKLQLNMTRMPVSQASKELQQYCVQNGDSDPLVTPGDRKENPWVEKSKCNIV